MQEDSILMELGRRYQAHDSAHNDLQITISEARPGREKYNVDVSKDPGAAHFHPDTMYRLNRYLQKATADLVCLER